MTYVMSMRCSAQAGRTGLARRVVARLKNKVAIVTGAGSIGPGWGNGKAVAALFAREGAHVIAADRDIGVAEETAKIILDEGGLCTVVEVDVTNAASVGEMTKAVLDMHGRVDILHNNVGATGQLGGPIDVSEEDWDQTFTINAKSIYLTCNAILPAMLKAERGSIINVSSIAAIRYTGIPYVSYAASKAAVLQFTQSVALQYAAKGIRCNALLPGLIDTPMVHAQLTGHYGDKEGMLDRRNATSPTGKMGDAWDVAYAALYLASDEARYVNGTSLIVDGGLTAGIGPPA